MMLLNISNISRVEVFCESLHIFITPAVCELLPPRYRFCSLVLFAKMWEISSAALKLTSLLEILNVFREVASLKACAISMAPVALRLLSPR